MTAPVSTPSTRVLLSFGSAYADLARRIADDLRTANIDVRYDPWHGGGGVPAHQAVAAGVEGVAFVLALLTPSDATPTWIGDEWRLAIHDPARARGIAVLPLRGDGDLRNIPDFLRDISVADLREPEYAFELRRLVTTIRRSSGDDAIRIPDAVDAVHAQRPRTATRVAPLTLEVGDALAAVLTGDGTTDSFVDAMVPMMLDGLFYELGVQFPELQVRVGHDLAPSFARVVIYDVPEYTDEVHLGWVMVNESTRAVAELGLAAGTPARPATNPATGAASAWIPAQEAAAARNLGLLIWDAREFLVLALSATLRRKAASFIGMDDARAMLGLIEPVFPRLVAETVPRPVSWFVLTDVLRRLVAENVSIRNLRGILMALADCGRVEADPHRLTEHVRAALQRQITHQRSRGTNELVVFLLDPEIEAAIRGATRYTATGSYVDLAPAQVRRIMDAIREPLETLPDGVQVPAILTTMEIRAFVRRLVAPVMPELHVVSYQEVRWDATIRPVGRISLDGFESAPGIRAGGMPVWADSARDTGEDNPTG